MADFRGRVFRQVLCEWIAKRAPVDRVLRDTFREHRLGPEERREIGDRVFDWVRHWSESGLSHWTSLPSKPQDLVDLDQAIETLWSKPWSLEHHERLKPRFEKNIRDHLVQIHGLNEECWPEFKGPEGDTFGIALHQYLHASWEPAPTTLRWLASKTDLIALQKRYPGSEPSEFVPQALHLSARTRLDRQDGLFEIQDESSQLVSWVLNPQPGEKILDMCAGAGGKTLHLAALMQNKGEVFAYDRDQRKLQELMERARRQGWTNLRCLDRLPEGERFDAVLVDAPCTSIGVLRRSPDRWLSLKREHLESLLATQRELASRALDLVSPTGRVYYSTCSIRADEAFPRIGIEPKPLDLWWMSSQVQEQFETARRQSPAASVFDAWTSGRVPNVLVWGWSSRQGTGGFRGDGFSLCRLQ
jgi:16S rRNA (cytosine967-C5)-methyltransferase